MHSGMRNDAPREWPRFGLTLLEVCLVLAILVVIAGISLPLMEGTLSRAALEGGSDLLRGAWAKARLAAMQSGETYVFRFEPQGSRFQIVALDSLGAPELNELAPDENDAEPFTSQIVSLSDNRLPDGIVFTGGDVSLSNQLMAMLPTATEGPWSQPILFHPDGTTSDAYVLLANNRQITMRVSLRGLTGISQTVDAESEASP